MSTIVPTIKVTKEPAPEIEYLEERWVYSSTHYKDPRNLKGRKLYMYYHADNRLAVLPVNAETGEIYDINGYATNPQKWD